MCVGRGCRADKPLLDFEIWCFPINVLVEKYFSLSFKLIKWNFTTIGHPWKMLLPPVSTREKTSQIILLRSESPINKCAKLHTEAAINNRDHAPRSLYYCLIAPHIYISVVLRAHAQPFRLETHIQRNANGEVATTSPPFYNEPHWSHVLFCEGWTSHDLHILVTAPFCCDRKSPSGMCAKLHTVAASNNRDHTPWSFNDGLFSPQKYGCCSSRTSRSWWIAHSTQRQRRGCNNTRSCKNSVVVLQDCCVVMKCHQKTISKKYKHYHSVFCLFKWK